MNGKTLKFDNVEINKKEFHVSKQPFPLNFVNVNQILIAGKFKQSDMGFKYFIGYKDDNTIRPLCIVLPQISGYVKYFDISGKNMSFMIKDDSIMVKHNEIWNKI